MRRFGIVTFIIGFITVALFGLSLMSHIGAGDHSGCVAAIPSNQTCPVNADPITMLGIHFDALSKFSSGIFIHPFSALSLYAVVIAAFVVVLRAFVDIGLAARMRVYVLQSFAVPVAMRPTGRWLAMMHRREPASSSRF